MWKSAFKLTVPASVAEEGGPSSPVEFLQQQAAALAVLEKHGIAGSLKNSWDSGETPSGSLAWVGVKIKADPTGLALKKLVEALQAAVRKGT
eukprot:3097301-Prymnesium_polylepis.1